MQKYLGEIDLTKGNYSANEIKEKPEYYKFYLLVSKLLAEGIDIDKILKE